MTCAADLFTALETGTTHGWSTDTGSGGLFNTASAAYVPIFIREGDSNNRGLAKPRIEVQVLGDETDRFGKDSINVLVKFHIYTDVLMRYGTGERNQDAIVKQMRVRFHRYVPDAQSTWSFSEMAFGGEPVQMPTNLQTNELHAVVNARLTARKV